MDNYLVNGFVCRSLFTVFAISFVLIFGCTTQSEKPNIIIINVDDLGWMDLGYQGSKFYVTPNIDALAKQGMIFTNGYASASNCAPSRAVLMTGLWTPRHGIYTVGSSERGQSEYRKLVPITNTTTLSRKHTVLPEVLANHGYTSCLSGKWHLSDDPEDYGFDLNIGGGHNGHPKSYYPPYGNVDLEGTNDDHLTDLIVRKTVGFIDSVKSPFFLYYTPYAVHTPIQGIDSLKVHYADKPSSQGQNNIDYATMIENLDRNIGLMMITLKETGKIHNTLIIFTSDNGGLYGITYQKPLRAGKGSYYEGGIRVPFFFVWNNRIEPGSSSDTPITNLDLFPTILDVVGIDLNQPKPDGQSLLSILKTGQPLNPRPLFWHFPIYLQAYDASNNQNRDSLFRTRPGSVVRSGDWKLHQYYEDGGLELYNLKDDIGEQRNLANENPKKLNELLTLLNNWKQEVKAPVPDELNTLFEQ